MVYNTEWVRHRREECVQLAMKKATLDLPGIENIETNFLWRFEDVQYAGPLDEYDNLTPPRTCIEVIAYPIIKHTPMGCWIVGYFPKTSYSFNKVYKRFVLKGARKQFASATVDEGLKSFIARKERQASIHEATAARIRWIIRKVT